VTRAECGELISVAVAVRSQDIFIPLFQENRFVISSYEMVQQVILELPRDLFGLAKSHLSISLNISFAILNLLKLIL
jgi:hypothetical protein